MNEEQGSDNLQLCVCVCVPATHTHMHGTVVAETDSRLCVFACSVATIITYYNSQCTDNCLEPTVWLNCKP